MSHDDVITHLNCRFIDSGRLSILREASSPSKLFSEDKSEIIEFLPSNSNVKSPFGTTSSASAERLNESIMGPSSP